jgi:hypothetical protein
VRWLGVSHNKSGVYALARSPHFLKQPKLWYRQVRTRLVVRLVRGSTETMKSFKIRTEVSRVEIAPGFVVTIYIYIYI